MDHISPWNYDPLVWAQEAIHQFMPGEVIKGCLGTRLNNGVETQAIDNKVSHTFISRVYCQKGPICHA